MFCYYRMVAMSLFRSHDPKGQVSFFYRLMSIVIRSHALSIHPLKNQRVFTSYRPRFVYIFPSLLSHQLVQKSPHLHELYNSKTSHLLPPWVAEFVLHQDSIEPTVHILFAIHAPYYLSLTQFESHQKKLPSSKNFQPCSVALTCTMPFI